MRLAMNHRQIVNALGGYRIIASDLGLSPVAVWRWQQRGIPAKHWPRVIEMARANGVDAVTSESLMRGRYEPAAEGASQ